MIAPTVYTDAPTDSGYWRVIVDPLPSSLQDKSVDVTIFRGFPTNVESLSTTDPFGPASATITFGGITLLDSIGSGELDWLVPEANVDIIWMSPQINISAATQWNSSTNYSVGNIVNFSNNYYRNILAGVSATRPNTDTARWEYFDPAGTPLYTWEGYFVSFEFGEEDAGSTLTVQCNGAMKQMDNYLAYPEYLTQPMSYEFAIERQFDKNRRLDSRMKDCIPFKQTAKTDPSFAFLANDPQYVYTPTVYTSKDAVYLRTMSNYFTPIGLKKGDIFSGMLTRSTGNFDPVLSTYIQNLLTSMQTANGSISLMLGTGRQPFFKHRTRLTTPSTETLIVDLLWPGVKISLTQDFTQKINVVYGKGKALNGDSFSNLVFDADGSKSRYEPFAAKAENYPQSPSTNRSFNANIMSKETQINFYDGLNAADAKIVATKALDVFADPGITGQITLTTDPKLNNGSGFARQKITAGSTILVQGLFGNRYGIMFHITEHSYSSDNDTVTLTIDSKYRDQLTVQEVRKRGKDSLVIARLLGLGQYQPNIDDLLFPWSYEQGSGFVPLQSKHIWDVANKDGKTVVGSYPWLGLTKKYTPAKNNVVGKKDSSKNEYAVIGKADTTNANNNWSAPIPVMFSAKGTIHSVRFAAYKKDGTPYNVPFHVSLWYENAPGLNYTVTPALTTELPFQLTTTNKANGTKLAATLTLGIVEGTGARVGTVTATLKFSSNAKTMLTALSKTVTPILIKDSKNITGAGNQWFSDIAVNLTKFTITFPVDKDIAVSMTRTGGKKVLTETVKKIYVQSKVATTPRALGLIPAGFSYDWGQHYPFYPGAWEKTTPEGNEVADWSFTAANTPIVGWGNYFEQAGYYPNSGGNAQTVSYQPPTGQFVDDTPFSYDFISQSGGPIVQDTPSVNATYSTDQVTGTALFYCDQEWDGNKLVPRKQNVYFIGRMYRQPPGA